MFAAMLIRAQWAAAFLVVAACSACGSSAASSSHNAVNHPASPLPVASPTASSSSGTSTTSSSARAPTYTAHVAVSGQDSVAGAFNATAVSACGPPNDLSGTVAGHHVDLQMSSAGPAGQQVQLSPGDIVLVIDSDNWGVGSGANAPQGTTGTLQRNDDGSGALTFQNLYLQSNPSQVPQESGSITWTCG